VQAGSIDAGKAVLVTGFDPWSLTVREATAEEVAAQPAVATSARARSEGKAVLYVVGAVVFGMLFLVGSLVAFRSGGVAGFGYLLAVAGQLWLLVQIARECPPDFFVIALLVPFASWVFVWQRWDIAKWPFLVNVFGAGVYLVGLMAAG
jgi:hypothetical protein